MPTTQKLLTAAAGSAGGDPLYVEDVFSTDLWLGVSATALTVNNGVDLDGEGGMVWVKGRSVATTNCLVDTERLVSASDTQMLHSDTTAAAAAASNEFGAFTSTGYTIPYNTSAGWTNFDGRTNVGWTFRKAEKFFDVVTYTGNATNRTISHNLGSTPGLIIVKNTNITSNWFVYHQNLTANAEDRYINLNATTGESGVSATVWNRTAPTDSVFSVGTFEDVNGSGNTMVAYLFASDAGGFGDDGDENIIKCGSYTGNSGSQEIDCGFEAQWVLIKAASDVTQWYLWDSMRGIIAAGTASPYLKPNQNSAEASLNYIAPLANGFIAKGAGEVNDNGVDFIYMAIRRPMKTPEAGTEVYLAQTANSSNPGPLFSAPFPVDMVIWKENIGAAGIFTNGARLLQGSYGATNDTSAWVSQSAMAFDYSYGWRNDYNVDANNLSWMFSRATGFMDVVAYTGTGGTSTQAHNLGVVPELMIFKRKDGYAWNTYVASSVLASAGPTKFLELNDSATIGTDSNFLNGAPTSSLINTGSNTNQSTRDYIAYLFATLAGVSKVGTYTGTGADLNVDCGFTAGARFILIKKTDAPAVDWYLYDSIQGISAGNDPYLRPNQALAQVTGTDYIDPLNAGFTVTSNASSAYSINQNGGTYIFLAIA